MVRVSNFIVPKGYRAITLYPFIFVRNGSDKYDKVLINHERIHLRQQLELLILPFFVWYAIDFLVKLICYRNWQKAYRNIVFECEAYSNQGNLVYLNTRKIWQFKKYLTSKP
ncbi:hypothetical protein [Capnocytophaga sp. HP1101]